MLILAIIFLILFVPQVYYAFKRKRYKSLDMASKFFKRMTVLKEDGYEEMYLTNTDGADVFVRVLSCENPKAVVQLVHGVSEHSGNYMEFARFLNQNGYIVAIDDHRGHGRSISSAYPNGFMNMAEELVDDEIMIANYMKDEYPNLEHYMIGHSMGSMIARLFLRRHDDMLDKFIVMGTVPVNKFSFLGVFFLNIACFYLGSKTESRLINSVVGASGLDFISYDRENIEVKSNDPLRIFRFKLGYTRALIDLNRKLGKKADYECKNPNLKTYNMVGAEDIITKGEKGVADSLNFLKSIGYKDVSSKSYEHMKHEILCETNKEVVYHDILNFFDEK